jgi:hypothetical protein
MLQESIASSASNAHITVERVRRVVGSLGCANVWARASGPYVLLGLGGGDAFARLTALGGGSYGLAFRTVVEAGRFGSSPRWEPLLLVDELADVIEHALVGANALPLDDAAC